MVFNEVSPPMEAKANVIGHRKHVLTANLDQLAQTTLQSKPFAFAKLSIILSDHKM